MRHSAPVSEWMVRTRHASAVHNCDGSQFWSAHRTFRIRGRGPGRNAQEHLHQWRDGKFAAIRWVDGIIRLWRLQDSSVARINRAARRRQVARSNCAGESSGRRLYVVTTNIDAQRTAIWDMGKIASSDDPGALELFRNILTASASIPGLFSPVLIDVEGRDVVSLKCMSMAA